MSEHRLSLSWSRGEHAFTYDTYPREHVWSFDDGTPDIRASAAPGYLGHADALDPEQALVGAIASCHMLTFLAIAAKKRWVVERYAGDAVGTLGKNEEGRMAILDVALHPEIEFGGDKIPDAEEIAAVHEKAHKHCFIGNSVNFPVRVAHAV